MIVYDLGCENSHRFEGWFSSSEDFEKQQESRLVSCPLCGSATITRLPHASYVNTGAGSRESRETPKAKDGTAGIPQQYANVGAEVLASVIKTIIENTEDVGRAFPEEARKIHYQEAPARQIRGTASAREVEALKEEGVDVVALPVPLHLMGKSH